MKKILCIFFLLFALPSVGWTKYVGFVEATKIQSRLIWVLAQNAYEEAFIDRVSGKYRYVEEGMSGELIITKADSGVPFISINTVNLNNYHVCDLNGEALVEGNTLVLQMEYDNSPMQMPITFDGRVANIETGTYKFFSYCGFNGFFTGEYIKVKE